MGGNHVLYPPQMPLAAKLGAFHPAHEQFYAAAAAQLADFETGLPRGSH